MLRAVDSHARSGVVDTPNVISDDNTSDDNNTDGSVLVTDMQTHKWMFLLVHFLT